MISRNLLYFVISFLVSALSLFIVFQHLSRNIFARALLSPIQGTSQIASPSSSISKEIVASRAGKLVLGTASGEIATLSPKLATKPKVVDPFPKVVTPQPSPQTIDSYFEKYSKDYQVEESLLRKIAVCESGYNTSAENGVYGGMFQFTSLTWISTRQSMGENIDPDLRYNAEEAIKTAAYKISQNGIGSWKNCG